MKNAKRFGFVVTHADEWGRLIDMPWLENEYWINERDRIVLAVNDWRAIADGDGRIWDALKRKLRVGCYDSQPQLIAVVGHPSGRPAEESCVTWRQEVRRIVRRIRSIPLPAPVMGLWTDADGSLRDVLDPDDGRPSSRAELEAVH